MELDEDAIMFSEHMTLKGVWFGRLVWGAALGAITALQGALTEGRVTARGALIAVLAAALGGAARAMQDGSPWDGSERRNRACPDDERPL